MADLPAPKRKPPPDPDTLTVSMFRMFTVSATGRGLDFIPKLIPWLIFAAGMMVVAAMVTGGNGIAFVASWIR